MKPLLRHKCDLNQCFVFCRGKFYIMAFQKIIGLLLLTSCLQIIVADKSFEVNKHEFRNKMKEVDSGEEKYEKFKEAAYQFQKDYSKWEGKKYKKYDSRETLDDKDYMKINEVESGEYVDKYNKYGKTFNPNILKAPVAKIHHNKKELSEEKEKPGSLAGDVNVNYINNNKEVSKDSELINENTSLKNKENYQENYQNKNETFLKRYKKDFYHNINKIEFIEPPPSNDSILMARYVVHVVDWVSLGTLSGRSPTKGSPFVCVKAMSDGVNNFSTGIPFFYLSPLDLCTQDLQKDNRVSVLISLLETEYCRKQDLDPQDPRCAKLTLTGKVKKIKPGSEEEKFARNALFSRHPAMKTWPADHNWYFAKLKIGQIILLDQFGGAKYIKVKDYLSGKVTGPEL